MCDHQKIETARTWIRPWRADELHLLQSIFGNPEVSRHFGGPRTTEQIQLALDFFLKHYKNQGFGPMGAFEKTSGQLLGIVGIKRLPELDHPDLGVALLPDAWGKGYANETCKALLDHAFHVLKQTKIYAHTDRNNTQAIALLKKYGFVRERSIERNGMEFELYSIVSTTPEKNRHPTKIESAD